jgi:hypothetical protein
VQPDELQDFPVLILISKEDLSRLRYALYIKLPYIVYAAMQFHESGCILQELEECLL